MQASIGVPPSDLLAMGVVNSQQYHAIVVRSPLLRRVCRGEAKRIYWPKHLKGLNFATVSGVGCNRLQRARLLPLEQPAIC